MSRHLGGCSRLDVQPEPGNSRFRSTYKEGGNLNHAICWVYLLVVSKYGDQRFSRLKMGSKILEQKVSPLPVDVGLLQQVHKMHGESMYKTIAKSTDMAGAYRRGLKVSAQTKTQAERRAQKESSE